jgi:hypothetical protein
MVYFVQGDIMNTIVSIHSATSRRILFFSLFILASFPILSHAQVIKTQGWQNLKYSIYFTSGDVETLLGSEMKFRKTMDYFAPVKPVHVYLEGTGRGEINIPLLKKVAERFRSIGIRVSGAMVPIGENGPSTYNNQKDMAALEKRMRSLAQVFDDIILDDWLFTTAVDAKSVEERGNQSWADYRTALLLAQSKKYIIDPAKEVNPHVQITIKYPNWYEGHRDHGYDVYHETRLYDHMAVGIETRNRMVHDQHIPIYSGYVFQKWWPNVEPKKWVGSWLDNYDMKGDSNDYVAQVWQAVLAQTPEIILWCGNQLYPTNPSSDVYPHFISLLPEFDRVAGLIKGGSRGVPMYLPYGSTGEYNIFAYLGMAGIPIEPVATFPEESRNAIFTLHSISEGSLKPDTLLVQKLLGRLRNGKDVFLTWGLWEKFQNTEFKNTLHLLPVGEGSVTSDQFRLREGWWKQNLIKSDRPITFPKIATTTWPYVRDIAVERDDYDYGVLFHVPYLNGNIYILNMPDNSYDLLRLPPEVLNTLRRAFHDDVNIELNGPGGVGMYLFGTNLYVLYNMSDETASLKLRKIKNVPNGIWRELVRGQELPVKLDSSRTRFGLSVISEVPIVLKPFDIAVVKAPQ